MDRRSMLGMMGVGAVGLTAFSARANADDKDDAQDKHKGHQGHDKIHQDCLQACGDCAKACDEAFHHCYMQVAEGKREHARSLHLVSDCAGFCALSACTIAKHSPLMAYSCDACAKACADTVAETSKFDSPEMRAVTKSLKHCEETCKAMVAAMGKGHHDHGSGSKSSGRAGS